VAGAYAGYSESLSADATYQYLRKAAALLTITVRTRRHRREYLLARKTRSVWRQSTVPGVTEGAASLLGGGERAFKTMGRPSAKSSRLESHGPGADGLEVDQPAGLHHRRNALAKSTVQPETRL